MIRVGTSGWEYEHWRGRFYPADVPRSRWLEHYGARFGTVEANSTFYRLPKPGTFAQWAGRVPDDFVFAWKASQYLTHFTRLREPQGPVERMLTSAAPLGAHLGPVLVQLPPNMRCAPDRLDATLRAFGSRVRVAVEARHSSWFSDEVRSVLRTHGAAWCMTDRGSRPATPLWRTTGWTYVRLHWGTGRPTSCYGRRALASWVARLRDLFGTACDAYVYFNNDPEGCAVRDAIVFAGLASRAGFDVTRVPTLGEAPVG